MNRRALTSSRPLALALLLLLVGAAPTGCGSDADPDNGPRLSVKVLTRNLYLGSELMTIVFTPTPEAIPGQAAAFLDAVKASDPVGRMQLLAGEIADAAPDLVALQEVERYRTQTPSNFDLNAPAAPDASEELFDFLALLQAGLAEHGLAYDAIEHVLSDAELPAALPGGGLMDVRLTDRDVILVRRGLAHTDGPRAVFEQHLPLLVGGKVPVKL